MTTKRRHRQAKPGSPAKPGRAHWPLCWAVWGIADPDDWAFGLFDMPPTHAPRPSYWAHALYTDHFGPTLLKVTTAPFGVSAHASRNQADEFKWGTCTSTLCYGSSAPPSTPAATIRVPFSSLTLGMPVDTLESSLLHAIQWVLGAPADSAKGQACSAHFTVSNVAFY